MTERIDKRDAKEKNDGIKTKERGEGGGRGRQRLIKTDLGNYRQPDGD